MTTPTNTSSSRTRQRPSIPQQHRRYDAANQVAATMILESPERHTRFQVDWARSFVARQENEQREAHT